MSPQADYIVANGTGAAVRSDINGQLAAIVSNNSGATEPATMYAYQWWPDTTTGLLKQRNSANSAWVTIGTLASTNLGLLPLAGGTMTGVLAVTAGTAALPGIAVSGDLNTGITSPGADQLAITTGGTSRLAVSTTAVSSTLAVDVPLGAVGTPSITFTGDLNTGLFSPGADTLALVTGGTDRVQVTSAGQILIGTTSTTGLGSGSSVNQGVQIGVGIVSSQRNDTSNNFWAKATGYTSGDYTAHYVNNTYVGGISTNGSTTTYAIASDYRLKENVIAITDGIARCLQLKPSYFNFIGHSENTVDGFLAHEVQQIVPEAVVGEKDATNEDGTIKPQGIDQSKLVPLLTAALQEAIAKIEALETRLSALEAA